MKRPLQSSQCTAQRLFAGSESSFRVSHIRHVENSAIGLSPSQMHDLNILQGDFLLVQGNSFTTVLNADAHDIRHGTVSLSRDVQKSLEVQPTQALSVQRCCVPAMVSSKRFSVPKSTHLKHIVQIKRVAILPFADTLKNVVGDVFRDMLAPYLSSESIKRFAILGRPAHNGDLFTVKTTDGRKYVQFEVCEMESDLGKVNRGIIGPEAVIYCEGRPIERKEKPVSERYRLPTTEVSLVEYNATQATKVTRIPLHFFVSSSR